MEKLVVTSIIEIGRKIIVIKKDIEAGRLPILPSEAARVERMDKMFNGPRNNQWSEVSAKLEIEIEKLFLINNTPIVNSKTTKRVKPNRPPSTELMIRELRRGLDSHRYEVRETDKDGISLIVTIPISDTTLRMKDGGDKFAFVWGKEEEVISEKEAQKQLKLRK